jgi:serine/threonine protein kinase
MAPEVLAGQPATFESDMFALGKTVFFVHFPWQQGSAAASTGEAVVVAHPNTELVQLLQWMLAADPTKRPTAAQATSAAYFTTSLLAEKEGATALLETLHAELASARLTQQDLEKQTQAFVEKHRALDSAEARLREEQVAFSELSKERKAELEGQAQGLKDRETQLRQTRLDLSGERTKLHDERKRHADAAAELSEKQRQLRASVAQLQNPPLYWSVASTASAFSEHDVTSAMLSRMQAIVDRSCKDFGAGRDKKTSWRPYTGLRVTKVRRTKAQTPRRTATHMFILTHATS